MYIRHSPKMSSPPVHRRRDTEMSPSADLAGLMETIQFVQAIIPDDRHLRVDVIDETAMLTIVKTSDEERAAARKFRASGKRLDVTQAG